MASSTREMDRALKRLYDRLPPMDCKGLCWHWCSTVETSVRERERAEQRAGRALKYDPTRGVCSMLDEHGRCSVHEVRPLVCRLWGMTERMRCQYGCVPEGGFVSDSEERALFREARRIGGVPPDRQEKRRRYEIEHEHHVQLWSRVSYREAADALRNRRLPR